MRVSPRHCILLVVALVLASPLASLAADATAANSHEPLVADTENAACDVLKRVVATQRDLPQNTNQHDWYCDFSNTQNAYLRIVGLHARKCDAASCLLGWFAVMRRSSVVLRWDLANDRIVPLDEDAHPNAQ